MKDLCALAGVSKQSLWKHQKRIEHREKTTVQMVSIMTRIRKHHKRMGCRSMYHVPQEELPVGRDIFEQIGFANGFKLKTKRNKVKTTWGQRVEVFPNLIEGLCVTGINQVWQSDIFYQKVEDEEYYGVTIEDVYSRKLLSLHMSKSLGAQENVKALKKAFKARRGQDLGNCILHSDRGSQYISQAHKELVRSKAMRMSMCKMPQENAYVERIQGTLKNQYLGEFELTKANLGGIVQKVIKWYNDEKPHGNLQMRTPTAFENYVDNLPKNERPKQVIFKGYSELST
ncbi:MAG TPA: IS3 family transposase, partial [Saprospiraceae bacterium]|nr:IS3 family transposase [Saprospiraceae bacterium]